MPKYIVPVAFTYKAHFLVEADSMENAMGKFAGSLTSSVMPSVKMGRELRSTDDGTYAERGWHSVKVSEFQVIGKEK